MMFLKRSHRVPSLAAVLLALACGGGGGGGGGGTEPPGPPVDLVITGGNNQDWFFNNPLPTALSVKAVDASSRAVPGVVVAWTVSSGAGAVSPTTSTTNASGIATTTDSVGSSTIQMVSATFTGLPAAKTFTEHAAAPPTSAAVDVRDNSFSPSSAVVQAGGTVTWTWVGSNSHNLTFTSGPAPRPTDEGDRTAGTAQRTITTVGTYAYSCTNHGGMNGTVTVVH